MKNPPIYPQHDRLETFGAERNAVNDFLDFLSEQNIALVQMPFQDLGFGAVVAPAPLTERDMGDLIGQWLRIDPVAYQAEKDAALAAARAASREAGAD